MAWNHNLLADLSGPHFLLLYLVVIVGTLVWVGVTRQALDPTFRERPPQVPVSPDPYEIAYLRGGENEVTRVATFALIQRGYLEINETGSRRTKQQRIGQCPAHGDLSLLSPLEQALFRDFSSPRTAPEIFQSPLPQNVKAHCAGYEQSLSAERLLTTEDQRQATKCLGGTAALIFLGLGGYKLAAALANGYNNVLLLLLMAVVSTIVLAVMVQTRRLSRRGEEYLRRLQQAFHALKHPAGADAGDSLVLSVSIFGMALLAATPQAAYGRMFAQSASSGGCGSGGGCGGGGCGGGGCGGGGCGGCGGG